jgi:hypothetical protein
MLRAAYTTLILLGLNPALQGGDFRGPCIKMIVLFNDTVASAGDV